MSLDCIDGPSPNMEPSTPNIPGGERAPAAVLAMVPGRPEKSPLVASSKDIRSWSPVASLVAASLAVSTRPCATSLTSLLGGPTSGDTEEVGSKPKALLLFM